MDELQKINVRFPSILYSRIKAATEDRKQSIPKFSMNDLIVEAVRRLLDGDDVPSAAIQERVLVPDDDYQQRRMTADEIAARVPGVRRGL